ncbi:MAG TPA: potassium-transporting ATPase subunit KdpA [Candidatus Limnocylindrales bacterium]|nr:potassium-transporting ATPase subunit KdpA [Candidatus Limnocylindrales bacterium]
MPTGDALTLVVLGVALTIATPLLGAYVAAALDGRPTPLSALLGPVERGLYRVAGIDPSREQDWRSYALSVLVFSYVSIVVLYAQQRLQASLPLDPSGAPPVPPDLALNTAVSFASNTNWQNYAGETTMSHLTQAAGLAVQNFASAAVGIAVAVALTRGLARRNAPTIGNFWADLTRTVLYVLLPLALLAAPVLVWQGVPQTWSGPVTATTLEGTQQPIWLGPIASQEAIKELGTNGGGIVNANSAHPFENPTPLTNALELFLMLVVPFSLTATFGVMVGDRRQGWALFLAMAAVYGVASVVAMHAEAAGNPLFPAGIDQGLGNMEGKEVRFGAAGGGLWAVATTATSTGAVNSMHDSLTPLGGLMPLFLILLGEVTPGGAGSGLYGILVFALIAVFIAGLMVGRTPEYLGKKIEAFEMKMAALVVLLTAGTILLFSGLASVTEAGRAGPLNAGPHGFSEILYAFASQAGNNGSAFAGLSGDTVFYNVTGAIAMLVGRYATIVPVLAIAGSLARKRRVAPSPGTMPTTGPTFVVLLVGVIVIVGALGFLPALAVGPIVEQLLLAAGRTF